MVALTPPPPAGADTYHPAAKDPTPLVIVRRDDPEPQVLSVPGNVEPEAFSLSGDALFVIDFVPPLAPERYRVARLDLAPRHRRRRAQQRGGAAGADARHRPRRRSSRPTAAACTRCTPATRPPTSPPSRSCTCSTSTSETATLRRPPARVRGRSARRGRGVAVGHPALRGGARDPARSPSSTRSSLDDHAHGHRADRRRLAATTARATATETTLYVAVDDRHRAGRASTTSPSATEWTLPGRGHRHPAGERRQRRSTCRSPTGCSRSTRARSRRAASSTCPTTGPDRPRRARAAPDRARRLREVRLLTHPPTPGRVTRRWTSRRARARRSSRAGSPTSSSERVDPAEAGLRASR